jgi:hypothetical protein
MRIRAAAICLLLIGVVLMAGRVAAADGKCECYFTDGSPADPPCEYVSQAACDAAAMEPFIDRCDFKAGEQCPVRSTDQFLKDLRRGNENREKSSQ